MSQFACRPHAYSTLRLLVEVPARHEHATCSAVNLPEGMASLCREVTVAIETSHRAGRITPSQKDELLQALRGRLPNRDDRRDA